MICMVLVFWFAFDWSMILGRGAGGFSQRVMGLFMVRCRPPRRGISLIAKHVSRFRDLTSISIRSSLDEGCIYDKMGNVLRYNG